MSILDGKRNPDGILASALTAGAGQASTNSVNVGRDYTMLEVAIALSGATPTINVFLQKRGEQVMGPAGPTRVLSDLGVWVNTVDANCPLAGYTLSNAGNLTVVYRVIYPRGEYQVLIGSSGPPSGTWSASYSLTGELR